MGFVVEGELEMYSLAPSQERLLELLRVGEATHHAVQLGVLRRRKETRNRRSSNELDYESSSQACPEQHRHVGIRVGDVHSYLSPIYFRFDY